MKDQEKEIIELKQALLKANQDIERLSKVKSDFVSIISHELRTPLTSIKESISLVLDGITGPINENQRKFLGIAKNNIDRLAKVITDILDFSKLESGRISMHKRKMNINELIKDAYREARSSLEKKGLELDISLSDEIGLTWLDPDRIKQALKNLLSNAIKFNKVNGRIKIFSNKECMDGREIIQVTVEDTGTGISKEGLPKLFKDFNPLDVTMTRPCGGIGLGLAISKCIIQLHGGSIWAESEKDIGSKFIFTLPIYKKDDEFNFLLDEAIERARHNNMSVALIVFGVRNSNDATDEVFSELEKTIASTVRGPEDKVIRFGEGSLVAVIAGTARSGAEKIIGRLKLKKKDKAPLNFGISIYPDEAVEKKDLVDKAEEDLKSKNNRI